MNLTKNQKQKLETILTNLGLSTQDISKHFANETNTDGFFSLVSKTVESYVKNNLEKFDLESPVIEGESKKFFSWNNLALIELKPTMYSFTHNRYGVVEGTDSIRVLFWELFATRMNNYVSNYLLGNKVSDDLSNKNTVQLLKNVVNQELLTADYPFISNYLGKISANKTDYAIVKFADSIPPLEIVWKNYLVGTTKHNLKLIDKYQTKDGQVIEYEGQLPLDIIRFDWRNPLPDKDECIPDEFAEFYINTSTAREVARLASHLLNDILASKGYELVDLCYFMNYEGNRIHSEITPDGMRIKKKGKSFDKDLWRQGKDKATIINVWTELYEDLQGAEK